MTMPPNILPPPQIKPPMIQAPVQPPIQPPTIQPPVQPPTIQPPPIAPPTIQPPIQPPTIAPPSIQPPTIAPPQTIQPVIQPPTIQPVIQPPIIQPPLIITPPTTVMPIEQIRNNARIALLRRISDPDMAHELEQIVYQWVVLQSRSTSLLKLYQSKMRSILINLNNEAFRNRVVDGMLALEEVVGKMPWELRPSAWEEALKDQEYKRHIQASGLQFLPIVDFYTCSRCGKKRCTEAQIQSRSGDEGYSYFIQCMNCKNKWVINS